MALLGTLKINKTCWCILAVPMLFMNGLALYKLWCSRMVPIGTSVCALDWDLSNYTGIKAEFDKFPTDAIRKTTIIGPEINTSFHGKELCKLKEDVLLGDRFCLLQNCTIANLTRGEK